MQALARFCLTVLTAGVPLVVLATSPGTEAPQAPLRPVTTNYFGTSVTDNYRYLENLQSPEVQGWMRAQNAYTRQMLQAIAGRDALASRIQSLLGGDLRRGEFTRRGARLFYEVLPVGAQLSKLAYRDGPQGVEHVLVDPATLSKDSAHHFALDWYSPSWDGRYVAYGISEGGSEKSVLHLMQVRSLRYPKATPQTPPSQTMYNAVSFLHVVGQHIGGDGDTAVFGRGVSANIDVPEGQGTYILLSPDSPFAVAVANHNMDNAPNTFYVAPLAQVRGADTPWQRIATPDDGVTDVRPHGERLYLLSEKGATRFRLLSIAATHPDLAQASLVVPQGAGVLDSFVAASDALYLAVRSGASFELQRVGFDGQGLRSIALPFSGTVSELATDPRQAGVMFNL